MNQLTKLFEMEPTNKRFFLSEFIRTTQFEGLSESLRDLESDSNIRAIRNGVMLPGALTIFFLTTVSWVIGSLSFLLTGLFILFMLLGAYVAYSLGYHRMFSVTLCVMVLGCTAILSIMNRDTGGVFINGLSMFLLMGAFLFSPRAYYWSLIPVVGTIFFQYLDGPMYWFNVSNSGYTTVERIALTLLWMVVFVAIAQIIRRNFFVTLEEVVSLNKELELTQKSLIRANRNLDELNKSLEDRIAERTKALQDALQHAEAASIAKDRFFATISHELRTPLNAIIGYSESITDILEVDGADGQDEIGYSAKNVTSAGRALLGLVNDVLEVSQLESRDSSLHVGLVNLDDLVDELDLLIAPMMEQNKNEFVINSYSDICSLQTDGQKLERILINLLGNAAKFTEKGTVNLMISDHRSESLMFEVEDSGAGIAAEKLEMIFEPFMQAEETDPYKRRHGGVGLGLAICKRLAKDLQGDLSVTSEIGVGTSFKLVIPKEIPQQGVL